jgi:hypothetical protein
MDKGGLERYERLVELLLKEDYSSLDVATALLKITMDQEAKEYSRETEMVIKNDNRFDPRECKPVKRSFGPRRGRRR